MEYLILIILLVLLLIIIFFAFNLSIAKIKRLNELSQNSGLNELVSKFPKNIEICKSMLKKLNNDEVTIEEDKKTQTSVYIVLTNKIIIGNMKGSFVRIQTIAHECLHSIQDKKILIFNYIFANFYNLYFYIVCIFSLFKIVKNYTFQIEILAIFGFIYYAVRGFLEYDAMTKAKFLAQEYMEKANIIEITEVEQIVSEYDKINDIGIKFNNYLLVVNFIFKLIVVCLIAFILR